MFWILFAGFFIFIAVGWVWSVIFSRKVKAEGIETEAVVSKIRINESIDSDGIVTRNAVHYVSYKDKDGNSVEAVLSNPAENLKEGSRITIRYIPGREEYPVMIG